MTAKILIIDDSSVVRASVRYTLTKAGHEVVEASDGQGALDLLTAMTQRGERVAMIVTDVNMPRMDGITFVKELKKTPQRFVPVLILTTEAHQTMKAEGKAAGAAGWLIKPFDDAQLLDVVKKFVR